MKRLAVAAACFAVGLVTYSTAWAAPAPPGDASGSALSIGDNHISATSAHAGSDGTAASAHPVDVGPIKFGGEAKDDAENGGAVVETPDGAPAYAGLAPWAASAGPGEGMSEAAVLRLEAGPVTLDVLESESKATYTEAKSTGSGSANGVDLNTPAGAVQVLHSEVNTEGKASSHLVGIGDVKIGTNEDLGKVCSLDVQVVSLACLVAKGGEGAAEAAVAVVDGDALGPVAPIIAVDTHVNSGTGDAAMTPVRTDTSTPQPAAPAAETTSSTSLAQPDAADTPLARTGFFSWQLALTGALLGLVGLVLAFASRVRLNR